MTFEIDGEHNTATFNGNKSLFDEATLEQVETLVNHPAFEGEENISIMPDAHWGSGATVGFTMPVGDKIVPNTIGYDIGCGMYASNFGDISVEDLSALDEAVRERVPTGFDVHDRNDYHMKDDFPWHLCRKKLNTFVKSNNVSIDTDSVEYGIEYFKNVCKKVDYDVGRAINSVGSLGGGNHFIEFGYSDSDELWCIIHSGSRGLGGQIASYWQDEAHKRTFEREGSIDIPESEEQYFEHSDEQKPLKDVQPDGLSIDYEKVREEYDGEAIEGKIGQLRGFLKSGKSEEDVLDWLEGEEAYGYIIDMIFAQTYASVSRKQMMRAVEDALDQVMYDTQLNSSPWIYDEIESVHNYIDFRDGIIRKGACRAHKGERLIVPLNMRDGTLICRGVGLDSWNQSASHGAGRAMSRTAAKDEYSATEFDEETDGVFMSETPLDEIPSAYKDSAEIEEALGESVEVVDRIEPVLSIKAD